MAGETALDLAGWRADLLELSGAALSSDAQQEVAKISKVVARLDRKGLTGPNPELTMAVRATQSDPPNLLLAREPNRVSPLLGYKTTQSRRLTDAYLDKLKAAFASPGPRNPFSGTLGREQLIRSQK